MTRFRLPFSRTAGAVAQRCRHLASGRLKRIAVSRITNEFAFSFAPEGWNYFRALVAEIAKNPRVRLEDTTFYRFFQHERIQTVRTLNDLLFLCDSQRLARRDGHQFYFGTYPWGDHVAGGPWGWHHDRIEGKMTRDVYGERANIWYQPGDTHPIEIEWRQTIQACESIRRGYHPFRHGEWPEVTLLVRRDGEWRAMRYNGQHRMAVLSHLGRARLTVRVPSATAINQSLETWQSCSWLPKLVTSKEIIVRESEVDDWPYVKQGRCSREQALEIFHAFFHLNGRERIEFLGLPAVY